MVKFWKSKKSSAAISGDTRVAESSSRKSLRLPAQQHRYALMPLLCSVILLPAVVLAQALGEGKVDRRLISGGLAWPSSGAWVGDSLYIVDAAAPSVYYIRADGTLNSSLDGQVAILAAAASRPSILRSSKDTVFLEDEKEDVILSLPLIGGGGAQEPEVTPIKQPPFGGLQLRAVYDWAPLGDGFLAFADFKDHQDSWNSGFVFFDKSRIKYVYEEIEPQNPARNRYLRTNPSYIATIGNTGYFLNLVNMDSPVISRIELSSGIREDLKLPADFRSHPIFDGGRLPGYGPTKETAILKIFEVSRMPAGILAWKEELFVLGKEKRKADGSTDWLLIGINPESGKVLSRVELPTDAAHLSLYPGTSLSLLEKAPVVGYGKLNAPYLEAISVVTISRSGDLKVAVATTVASMH